MIRHGDPPAKSPEGLARRATRAIERAVQQAQWLGSDWVEPEHILLGLLGVTDGLALGIIASYADIDTVRARLLGEMGHQPA